MQVNAAIPGLKHHVEITYQQTATRVSPREMEEARERVAALAASEEERAEAVALDDPARFWRPVIAAAERLLAEQPAWREQLTAAIHRLSLALTSDDLHAVETAGAALSDLVYEIKEAA